jgi:hypothetical protein
MRIFPLNFICQHYVELQLSVFSICGMYNDAVRISQHVTSNVTIIGQLRIGRILKKLIVSYSKECPRTYLEKLSKSMKKLQKLSSRQTFNRAPSAFKSEALVQYHAFLTSAPDCCSRGACQHISTRSDNKVRDLTTM